MARKRERFERTDVPEPSPRRNAVGAVVCVLALAATALVVYLVWNHVSGASNLGDVALGDALGQQASAPEAAKGYTAAEGVSCTLLLTADSLDDGATLSSARILAVNAEQGTASLVNLPADLALTVDGSATTLSELFSTQGYAACVVPVASAAGVSFSNAILATGDVLEAAASLAGQSPENLVSSASGLLSGMRTNMDATGLLAMADTLSSIGVANLVTSEAPLVAETAEDEEGNATETGRQVLDRTKLGVALGTLVAAS